MPHDDTNPSLSEESIAAQEINEKDDSDTTTEELEITIWQLQEQLARAQADYANLVRRSREESVQIGQWTEDKIIVKFLPILDNLERALEHIPSELSDSIWVEWNKSIVRSMQKVITDFGVFPMNTIGQEINPDFHDVISQVPHDTTAIQAEAEKWYMRWGKALRHAKVIVGDGQEIVE